MTELPAPLDTDQTRLERARNGDPAAFALLWADHSDAALRWARRFVAPQDAEDLASEAFARVFEALRSGAGPRDILRPYLYTVVRNLAAQQSHSPREIPIDTLDEWAATESAQDSLSDWDDAAAAKAFLDLPNRWRTALWYTEVEGLSPAAAAPLLGLAPNAVAALAGRARSALREQWLQVHVRTRDVAAQCAPFRPKLAALLRGNLSDRATERVTTHLESCASCTEEYERLRNLNRRLLAVFIPILFGVSAARLSADGSGAGNGQGGSIPFGPNDLGGAVAASSASTRRTVALIGAAVVLLMTTGGIVAVALSTGDIDPNAASERNELPLPSATAVAETPRPTSTPVPSATPTPETAPPNSRGPVEVQTPPAPGPPPPPPALIANGDFEGSWNMAPYRYLPGDSLGAWNVVSGQVSMKSGGPGPSTGLSLEHYVPVVVDFFNDSPTPFLSAVSQTFLSTAGETYEVEFWVAGQGMFQVLRGGTVIETFALTPGGALHTTTFSATQSPTEMLVFQSYWPVGPASDFTYAFIDDIVMTGP